MISFNMDLKLPAVKWTFRNEGKEYIVKDGDVMHFRFNV